MGNKTTKHISSNQPHINATRKVLSSDDYPGIPRDPKYYRTRQRLPNVTTEEWILMLRREAKLYERALGLKERGKISETFFKEFRKLHDIETNARNINYHKDVLPISKIVRAPKAPPPSPPTEKVPIHPLTKTARLRLEKALHDRQKAEHAASSVPNLPGSVPCSYNSSAGSGETKQESLIKTNSLSVVSLNSVELESHSGRLDHAKLGYCTGFKVRQSKIEANNRALTLKTLIDVNKKLQESTEDSEHSLPMTNTSLKNKSILRLSNKSRISDKSDDSSNIIRKRTTFADETRDKGDAQHQKVPNSCAQESNLELQKIIDKPIQIKTLPHMRVGQLISQQS